MYLYVWVFGHVDEQPPESGQCGVYPRAKQIRQEVVELRPREGAGLRPSGSLLLQERRDEVVLSVLGVSVDQLLVNLVRLVHPVQQELHRITVLGQEPLKTTK